MAQVMSKTEKRSSDWFPPEADGQFDVVPDEKIATWREKLAERFGIGSGRLTPIEEPSQ